ncbi:MAG: Uncharacterized protein G01um101416_696 [Microgenomates group bacterium Gr01-1014_16]|nr:MAG: Uncharacterized protein G01um101416_696 [Microgenomates group bacterium Gr01-1014_16]
MRISGNYGSHLGPLIKVMSLTDGPVLELGIGFFSTPYLHYQCLVSNRYLASYDNDRGWVKKFASQRGGTICNFKYESPNHHFFYVDDWAKADIEKPWDVVLVDHSPGPRRAVEIKRLANFAKFIVVHDADPSQRGEREYHYSSIYPLFKYKKFWNKHSNLSVVLSNFVELEGLWT